MIDYISIKNKNVIPAHISLHLLKSIVIFEIIKIFWYIYILSSLRYLSKSCFIFSEICVILNL